MNLNAVCTTAVLALLLAGAGLTYAQDRPQRMNSLDLLRLRAEPWTGNEQYDNVIRIPRVDPELEEEEEGIRSGSEKRSAVATALNSGRRRRQPASSTALGVLNDMSSFFDSLRDNLEVLASLTPQERSALFDQTPQVSVHGGKGGGSGMRKLHALRPLKPTGNIRSYNRRSYRKPQEYPRANNYNPELLWTGLGR